MVTQILGMGGENTEHTGPIGTVDRIEYLWANARTGLYRCKRSAVSGEYLLKAIMTKRALAQAVNRRLLTIKESPQRADPSSRGVLPYECNQVQQ